MFCDLIGDYLSSPRSGELADFTWGNVVLLFPVYKNEIPGGETLKVVFDGPY